MTIRETIQRLIDEKLPVQVVVGTIQAVDETEMSCDVLVEGRPDRYQVRLRAVITDDTGFVIVPAKESFVLLALIENRPESCFICGFSEVEYIQVKIEDTTLKIDKAGFALQRQNESLKKLLEELLDAIAQLTVPTGTGPSGVPVNAAAFTSLKQRLTNLLTA